MAALALGVGAAAATAEVHVFDPVLSLTGGCTTSKVDLVPDPSCPGGTHPPAGSFSAPTSVTTDSYGNLSVASFGQAEAGSEGRVNVFDSAGVFITELMVPTGPKALAVDSSGNLFVINAAKELLLYSPSKYEPAVGKIEYNNPVKVIAGKRAATFVSLKVNPLNNHLFAYFGPSVTEYGSVAEESKVLDATIGAATLGNSQGIGLAIDASRKRIYASDEGRTVKVFDLEAPHELLLTIDGSTTPAGKFSNDFLSLAVDEGTGHLFVYDAEGAEVVYELTEDGGYVSTIDHELNKQWVFGAQIAVDNGVNSPNGALNPFERYLFVPAYPSGNNGHSFAFGPPAPEAPLVKSLSFSNVTEGEAELSALIEPRFLDTDYAIEYTTEESFEAEGFLGAETAEEATIPAAGSPVDVAGLAENLEPDTTYRFRVLAENELGSDEAENRFATYPASPTFSACPNDPRRIGLSALLPDCRAYELVTPPDTNARAPLGLSHLGIYFQSRQASPAGDIVTFLIEGGSLPGSDSTGSLGGDPYRASRGETGWSTVGAGPTGAEAPEPLPGSTSPDQGYSFWSTGGAAGSAAVVVDSKYVRYPDGHSALVGRGSSPSSPDPLAKGKLISDDGGHIVFVSGKGYPAVQLEPNAPPAGTDAIYDRTADEVTHVVSLLPGEETPEAGEDALYQGASLDGEGIAFSIGGVLYLRYRNEATYELGEGLTFAGISEGGGRIFYLKGANLYAFDVSSEEEIPFTNSGKTTVVNVAAEGSRAYFASTLVLTGEPNPNGALPENGQQNLYLSEEGVIYFVGTVTKRDVDGEGNGNEQVEGLGLWTERVGAGRLAADPSRATPDGSALLFESRADLTGYDPEGHAEIYRFDQGAGTLDCLSCIPTLAAATADASLQSLSEESGTPEPLTSYSVVPNLRADGDRAFFQSTEALVSSDTDGLQDVYEWEAAGVGSCASPGGCVYLVSSGHSDRVDYLFGLGDSGDDVFFRSSDLLLGVDDDETPSIYDARIGGGFVEEEGVACEGEGCKPGLSPPPALPIPGMSPDRESGNAPPPRQTCPKGKRKVKQNGKVRCVKKKQGKRKAGKKRKGAGR